jgi:hypothetical protein
MPQSCSHTRQTKLEWYLGRKRKEELLYNRYSILHNEKVLEMCCITKYLYLTLLYYTFKMAKMVNFITFDLSKREEAIKYIQKKYPLQHYLQRKII